MGSQCPGLQVPVSPSPESGSELGSESYRQVVGDKEALGRAGGPVLMGWTEKLGQMWWLWPGRGGMGAVPAAGDDAHSSGAHCRVNLLESMMCVDSPLPKLKMWVSRASTMGVSPLSLGTMP